MHTNVIYERSAVQKIRKNVLNSTFDYVIILMNKNFTSRRSDHGKRYV